MYDFVMGVYSNGPQVLEEKHIPSYPKEDVKRAIQAVFERKAMEVVEKVRDLNELKKHYAGRNLSVIEIRRGLETVINGEIEDDNMFGSLHSALLGLMVGLGNLKSYKLDNWDKTWHDQIKNNSYLRGLLTQKPMNKLLETIKPGILISTTRAIAAGEAAREVAKHGPVLDIVHLEAIKQTSQQAQQLASPRGQQGQGQRTTGQPTQTIRTQQTR
jgi:hypothetical protein